MSRPPYRPPSGGGRRTAFVFVAIIVAMGIIAYTVTFWVFADDDDDPPAGSPAALVGDLAAGNLIVDVGGGATSGAGIEPPPSPPDSTPSESQSTSGPAASPSIQDGCQPRCLVRLTNSRRVNSDLAMLGLRPAYSTATNMWAGLTHVEIASVREAGFTVEVLDSSADTLHLFAVRTPEDGDDTMVRAFGDVIDQVGEQYIVRVPFIPVDATPLTNLGIAVEKFPPLPPDEILPLGDEELDPDLLWQLSGQIAHGELDRIIHEMEVIGAEDGERYGTRFYEEPGNVEAAEYIYREFASLGLTVSYDDFLADNGLLALNVLAELPGEDPSRVYMVMGHFDSINSDDNEGPAPGADDNASAIAAMIEIARVLAQFELPHPVVFFASNAEENVFQGANAFASEASRSGRIITGAFNLDAVGSPRNGPQVVLNADGDSKALVDLLIEVNDAYGLGQNVLIPPDPNEVIADDTVMRDWGIPTVLVARELYGWTDVHHTEFDVAETVDYFNVRMAAELILIGVATLLTDEETPAFADS